LKVDRETPPSLLKSLLRVTPAISMANRVASFFNLFLLHSLRTLQT
jgi:hypothetical protein